MDEGSEGERRVLEDINITPFFERHSGHHPAHFNLHAEIEETKDHVILYMNHPGLAEGEIKVDGDFNTIKVRMGFGEEAEGHFTNTYITPSPIDSDSMEVQLEEDELKVAALKIPEE